MKKSPFVNLLVRWAVLALGVVVSAELLDGIWYDNAGSLLAVVILLSLFNAVLKPLLVLFTLPFIIVTLGIGMVVINALLFLIVDYFVDGFHVDGFWSAFFAGLIVSITNLLMSSFIGKPRPPRNPRHATPPRRERPGDDVIDI